MRTILTRLILWLPLLLAKGALVCAQEAPLFEAEVLPIFQEHCTHCHGGDSPAAGLDLSSAASLGRGSSHGPVIVKKASQDSLLFKRISNGTMPPKEAGVGLSTARIETVRRWIDSGAGSQAAVEPPSGIHTDRASAAGDRALSQEARNFWSFRPPVKTVPPKLKSKQGQNPIDAFILRKLTAKGLNFSPPAPKRTILRRACFDLIGLPPTPREMDAFLKDRRPDAYERLIDRLLESPHYGERWGRHWLDAVGYTDEYGSAIDADRYKVSPNIWRYRDYVVRSFNQDKPFDRFLVEQLAGDEITDWRRTSRFTPENLDGLVATGYLRTRQDDTDQDVLNTPREHFLVLSQLVDNLGSGVLGLTVGCARCHDHKYDPIPQRDYYRLMAIFATSFNPNAWINPKKRNLPDVSKAEQEAIRRHNSEIDRPLKDLKKKLEGIRGPYRRQLYESRLEATVPEALREDVRLAFETPPAQRNAVQRYFVTKLEKDLAVFPEEIDALLSQKEKAVNGKLTPRIATLQGWRRAHGAIEAVWDMGSPPDIRLLYRGELATPGPVVRPGFPEVLSLPGESEFLKPAEVRGESSGRRLALARWLTRRDHPLTARVMVNRVWMHHFGKGIVATAGNFGRQGSPPTHPQLLDWLAVDFMENGWKLKRLHKQIMTSTVYRQSSRRAQEGVDSPGEVKDPANRLLWRMNLKRLEAEIVRDSILRVSGTLDPSLGGQAVMIDLATDGLVTVAETRGLNRQRRSLYLLARRNYFLSFLEVFDFPIIQSNCTRRDYSSTPLQALTLLNSEFVMQQAEHFAERVERLVGPEATPDQSIQAAFVLAFARPARADEVRPARRHLDKQRERYLALGTKAEASSRKALVSFCQMLLAANEFLYVE